MEEKIIEEFGCNADDSLHRVVRSFYLRVRSGPLEAIPVGSIVRLKPEMARETFCACKTEPITIGEIFEVLQDIQLVGADGLWIKALQGDEVKLSRQEAFDLLRKKMVREKKGE
jgi:hypothetical protein